MDFSIVIPRGTHHFLPQIALATLPATFVLCACIASAIFKPGSILGAFGFGLGLAFAFGAGGGGGLSLLHSAAAASSSAARIAAASAAILACSAYSASHRCLSSSLLAASSRSLFSRSILLFYSSMSCIRLYSSFCLSRKATSRSRSFLFSSSSSQTLSNS